MMIENNPTPVSILGGSNIHDLSPVRRLGKSHANDAKHGSHMVDIIDKANGHVLASCVYERYADEIIAAVKAQITSNPEPSPSGEEEMLNALFSADRLLQQLGHSLPQVKAIVAAHTSLLPTAREPHADDLAVERFAEAMKTKLAKKREEGRSGWDNAAECSVNFLAQLLRDHVAKGDPVDVGNFAMMIHQRGGTTR